MSSLENALAMYSKKFSGFTKNTFKIQPSGKTSGIQANDIVTINLPSNSIVSLKSFKTLFSAGITTAQSADNNQRCPAKADAYFARVEVLVGGVSVSQGNSFYNVLRHAKDAVCGSKTNPVSGHPEIVRLQSTSSAIPLSNDSPEYYPGTNTTVGSQFISATESPYCVDYWEGFLGTASPDFLDLSLMGAVQVRITMAPNTILTNSKGSEIVGTTTFADNTAVSTFIGPGSAQAEYEIKNFYALIDCISISDESLDAILSDQMSQQGYLPVPFKSYYAFQQAHSGSSKFQVSSQSIDAVWSMYRPSNTVTGTGTVPTLRAHSVLSAPLPVSGYVVNPATTRRGSTVEKYVAPAFCFSTLGPETTYQLQINNAYIPQAPLSGPEIASYTASNLPDHEYFPEDLTMAEYMLTSNVACTRLDMPGSSDSRVASGIDSRSSNVMCSLNSTGTNFAGATFDSLIFIETTCEMRISAGRSIVVVN